MEGRYLHLADQVGNAAGKDTRLTRTGAGQDQGLAISGGNGLFLLRVEIGQEFHAAVL
jgi:hypothetical protein